MVLELQATGLGLIFYSKYLTQKGPASLMERRQGLIRHATMMSCLSFPQWEASWFPNIPCRSYNHSLLQQQAPGLGEVL